VAEIPILMGHFRGQQQRTSKVRSFSPKTRQAASAQESIADRTREALDRHSKISGRGHDQLLECCYECTFCRFVERRRQ
jgi:hypothetical protein